MHQARPDFRFFDDLIRHDRMAHVPASGFPSMKRDRQSQASLRSLPTRDAAAQHQRIPCCIWNDLNCAANFFATRHDLCELFNQVKQLEIRKKNLDRAKFC